MSKEKEINIVALEFPTNVRTRPGMYIGATDTPDVILREVIDNGSDELMGSVVCNYVDIQLKSGQNGGWYVVADNGRGIPILWDEDHQCTKTELAVATLNAGSKFNKGSDDVSVGLNGVGVSCTNALSSRFVILSKITKQNAYSSINDVLTAFDDNDSGKELFYVLEFEKGIKVKETAYDKETIENHYGFNYPDGMSTIVAFIPDPEIWGSTVASYSKKSLAYLHVILQKFYNKEARIVIDGKEVSSKFEPYKFEFLTDIKIQDPDGRVRSCKFYANFECSEDMGVQDFTGSVNSLIVDRGIHIRYVKDAWIEALRAHFGVTHNYACAGLKLNVIAMCGEVDFSSQTKENCVKLDNLWSADVNQLLADEFRNIFYINEDYFKLHIERLTEYANSLIQISTINKIKSMVVVNDGNNTRVRSQLPTNVRDASSQNRLDCELYICEGKSAAGTILKSRDASLQAVMELRGVPLNSINRDLDEILENEEMCSIISAIGTGVNEYYNMESPRYGKIIIAADADSDGGRIASLVLGFFAKKMTFMIEAGMIYVLDSPLYKQNDKYIFPTDDVDLVLDKTKSFERYKGLGEVPLEDAERVITGSERRLIQITKDNAEYALNLLSSTYYRKDLMLKKGILIDKYYTGVV